MTAKRATVLGLLLLGCTIRTDVVHVAPPTGDPAADRASILAALEEVQAGGTVEFAPGTYVIGPIIRVPIPRITLLGHPDGTTLRGCDPAAFVQAEAAMNSCNGLELTGEDQTVRGLTFEYTWSALWIGCCLPSNALDAAAGEPSAGTELSHVGGTSSNATSSGTSPTGSV